MKLTHVFSMVITPKLLKEIQKVADLENVSKAVIVRRAVQKYLKTYDQE